MSVLVHNFILIRNNDVQNITSQLQKGTNKERLNYSFPEQEIKDWECAAFRREIVVENDEEERCVYRW